MRKNKRNILVTGGAGFIGTNLASHFAGQGHKITVLDNFIRSGTRENISWLKKMYPGVIVVEGDIRNFSTVKEVVKKKDTIYHLAAQVAVTTSVSNPSADFEINARGTFNILEGIRQSGEKPLLIYSSTNKVYGGMENMMIVKKGNRYIYRDFPQGVAETYQLDFHSPYGCSKGAADQYVRDYYRIYGIPTVVFRQSCIYGPHQFGLEDQGWIAWFMIASLLGKPITIYGDGMQVRDVLFVDDLVRAFETATEKIDEAKGKIYNVGGGPQNTLSIWTEFGPVLENLLGKNIHVKKSNWRPGDQKVYISNIDKIARELGWRPKISAKEGLFHLFSWVKENKEMLARYF